MADWTITAYLTADKKRFRRVGDDEWHGPGGLVYRSLAGLAEARGPLRVAEVANVHHLVRAFESLTAENALNAEAADLLAAERNELAAQVAETRLRTGLIAPALRFAHDALMAAPRSCPGHGRNFTAGRCCEPARLANRALRAIDAAAMPPATTSRGNDTPTPAGVGAPHEKER